MSIMLNASIAIMILINLKSVAFYSKSKRSTWKNISVLAEKLQT